MATRERRASFPLDPLAAQAAGGSLDALDEVPLGFPKATCLSKSGSQSSLTLDDMRVVQQRSTSLDHENKVKLNVGGTMFVTTLATLTMDRESMFAAMLSGRYPTEKDEHGALFIDR
jgi:hypothetical protein